MNIIDLHDPQRINRSPDEIEVLISAGGFAEQGFLINTVELRLYLEKTDERNGLLDVRDTDVDSCKSDASRRARNRARKIAAFNIEITINGIKHQKNASRIKTSFSS
mgnify:CR=1 FL=1